MVFCRDFHQLNLSSAQICTFIKNVSACHDSTAWFSYNEILYCKFADYIGCGVFLLVLWWLLLFLFLMITSDQFLCQSLQVIIKMLHLSQNIAGVTFLAFGNGAPDIFSAIAAVKNSRNGDASLAFGALLGAGLFVTTVVAGIISIIKPFKLMERPFLRDMVFYLVTLFFAFYVLWKKTITRLECIGFILLYIIYACVVIISRYIYLWLRNNEKTPLIDSDESSSQSDNSEKIAKDVCGAVNNTELSKNVTDKEELLSDDENHDSFRDFLRAINPLDHFNYTKAEWYWQIFYIIKAPLFFIQLLTIPLMNYDRPNMGWNRHLNSLHLITGSLLFVFATNLYPLYLGHLPVLVLALLVGCVLASVVFFTSSSTPPKYYPAFAFFSFFMSVLWIFMVANEVVNLLMTFGIVFNMSNVVVGVTFLAWGNSLGDLITDITIAKNDNPRTGISAVYGGQMFNLVLGIGIPFTILTWSRQEDFELIVTFKDFMLAAFLAFTLVSTFIMIPVFKFRMNRYFGCYLLILYGVFSVITLLTEISVIPTPVIN